MTVAALNAASHVLDGGTDTDATAAVLDMLRELDPAEVRLLVADMAGLTLSALRQLAELRGEPPEEFVRAVIEGLGLGAAEG